ncbi:unnamed protein product [Brassica oleracea var. botrytis]
MSRTDCFNAASSLAVSALILLPALWLSIPALWSLLFRAGATLVVRSVANRCRRYCAVEASAFAAIGASILAIAVIWSTAAFCAASCRARRAKMVSIDAGGGSGVAGVGVGVTSGAGITSRASRSSPDEELSLLTTMVLTLLC